MGTLRAIILPTTISNSSKIFHKNGDKHLHVMPTLGFSLHPSCIAFQFPMQCLAHIGPRVSLSLSSQNLPLLSLPRSMFTYPVSHIDRLNFQYTCYCSLENGGKRYQIVLEALLNSEEANKGEKIIH